MRYVIIGNSAAAAGAIEAIRERDADGSVTVISRESQRIYSRPLISYWLGRKVEGEAVYFREPDYYERLNVDTLLGVTATGLDLEAKKVRLRDRELEYDKLLLATGGKPIFPPTPGADKKGVFTFTTLDDAEALDEYLETVSRAGARADEARADAAPRAVVIGGGMIGIKAAEALVARGATVTVVELADRVLSLALDERGSQLMREHLEAAGVTVRTETTVEEVMGEDHVRGVRLKSGEELDCDLVVVAIGVSPNLDLVKNTAVETNRGILVDGHMATSVAGVYAAGDVAEATELLSGEKRVIPIWPNAYLQGRVAGANMAGANMAGGDATYDGSLVMNSIEFDGLPTISVGIGNPPDDSYEVRTAEAAADGSAAGYRKVVIKDGRLVGAVLVGAVDRAGLYTGLIREGTEVTSFKDSLLAEDFGLICLPRQLRAEKLTAGVK